MIYYLLQIGKQQHYQFGKWLRNRYDSLVGKKYSKDEIYIRSTDVDRTLMSALSNLAGFFPPQSTDVWSDELAWQPIPVHTEPEKKDGVLASKKTCPVYDHELKKLYKSKEFKDYDKQNKELYKYLTKHAGKKVDSLQSVQNIYSCLHIEQIYNKTLPEWTKSVYPDKLLPISGLSFATKTYTPLLARLKTGPLLKEILVRMHNKTSSVLEPNRSVWIYSAHDTTVSALLNTMGIFKTIGYHNPPYASSVLIELRKYNDGPRVQVFYRNTTGEPDPLEIPGCGTSCPLENMFKIYNDVLPVNWEEECSLSLLQMPLIENVSETVSPITIFTFMALMMFVGIVVLLIATFHKRRDYVGVEQGNYYQSGQWNDGYN